MISEEVAGVIASVCVGIGWTVKHLMTKFVDSNGTEQRRGRVAILRSMREEIDRLSTQVEELSSRLEEEVFRRSSAEQQLARMRGRVEALEDQVRRLGGEV